MPFVGIFGQVADVPANVIYQGRVNAPLPTSNSTKTITSVPIGAEAADRQVAFVVHGLVTSSRTLLSATIGGIAATIHVQIIDVTNIGTYYRGTAIISAPVPTGTTATVVLNYATGSTVYDVWMGCYSITGLISTTPTDTASTYGLGATISVSIDVTADGVCLAGCGAYSVATSYTTVGVTENYEEVAGQNSRRMGGCQNISVTEANRTISFTRSGSGSFYGAVCAVSFR